MIDKVNSKSKWRSCICSSASNWFFFSDKSLLMSSPNSRWLFLNKLLNAKCEIGHIIDMICIHFKHYHHILSSIRGLQIRASHRAQTGQLYVSEQIIGNELFWLLSSEQFGLSSVFVHSALLEATFITCLSSWWHGYFLSEYIYQGPFLCEHT